MTSAADSASSITNRGLKGTRWLKCCFTSTETVDLLGTGAQDVHLHFHTAPGLWLVVVDDRFYIALFSALEQTHCTRML